LFSLTQIQKVLSKRKNLPREIRGLLKEKNMATGKLEEAFSFLKDNIFFNFNCYNTKCLNLMF